MTKEEKLEVLLMANVYSEISYSLNKLAGVAFSMTKEYEGFRDLFHMYHKERDEREKFLILTTILEEANYQWRNKSADIIGKGRTGRVEGCNCHSNDKRGRQTKLPTIKADSK